MGTTKLNIGKIPISKGEYQEGTTYQRLNQVTMLGSTYQSKIDDNTSAPAQMGADGAVENINTDKWLCIAVGNVSAARKVVYNNETSGLEAGNVQEAIDEVDSKVSDLSKHVVFNLSYSDKITITINSEENKIIVVLPKHLTIIGSNSIRYYINESVEIQRDKGAGNMFFLIFNTKTKAFKIILYNEGLEANDVFMFGMNVATKQVTCNPNLVTFDALPATKASDVYYDNQYISDKTLNKAIDILYKKTFSYLNLYSNSKTLELEKFIENHYVDFSGNIVPYDGYDIYKPVKLAKGQAINVECISAEIAVISLSETENITEGSVLTVVAKSTNYGYTQSFTYIATSDCFVVVS